MKPNLSTGKACCYQLDDVTFPWHAEVFEVVDVAVDNGAVIYIFPKSLCDLIGLNFEEGKGDPRQGRNEI